MCLFVSVFVCERVCVCVRAYRFVALSCCRCLLCPSCTLFFPCLSSQIRHQEITNLGQQIRVLGASVDQRQRQVFPPLKEDEDEDEDEEERVAEEPVRPVRVRCSCWTVAFRFIMLQARLPVSRPESCR